MRLVPIVLFVYNRPRHTRETVEALLKNSGAESSDLIVFSDAARTSEKQAAVNEVRTYLKTITGFRTVTIRHRPHNFGLSRSIIEGVTDALQDNERVIVLEDDMVTSPYFLQYMNEALERFENYGRVASIHGYVYPVKQTLPEAFFLRGADCWGWGTWRRAWVQFNPDGQYLLDELRRLKLTHAFDFNGTHPFSQMLEAQVQGTNDSWAIRWHASAFLAGMLTLYPGRSLVRNIGNDSTGTHSDDSNSYDVVLSTTAINLNEIEVSPSVSGYHAFEEFFRASKGGWVHKGERLLRSFVRKIFA